VDEGEEVDCASIVSRGDTPKVFEFVEAAFDAVSGLVNFEVIGDQALSRRVAGNNGSGAGVGDEAAKVIAVCTDAVIT